MITTIMEKEILEQPLVLLESLEKNIDLIKLIAKEVKSKRIKRIVIAARGSSDHAAWLFKYFTEIFTKIPVSMASMSVYSLYNGKMSLEKSLVIGVSQSGGAADVTNFLERADKFNAITVAVTNEMDSPVALAAKYHLFLNVGKEHSVAATKTCLGQMLILSYLAAEIGNSGTLKNNLRNVPKLINELLKKKDVFINAAKKYSNIEDVVVLGRGLNQAAAFEGALKIQETCYIKARGYAISDFHHGPFASIEEGSNVILLAPIGKTSDNAREMYDKCLSINANVIVFTDDLFYETPFRLPKTNDMTAPFLLTVMLQLFALSVSCNKGLNPDKPRGLNKVTITL